MKPAEAGLYAASARRVLRARGLHALGERLRGPDERLVFVVGSPRSGTTFLAGVIGEQPGFVDLSEVNPHKAAIPELAGLPDAEAAKRIRATLERVRTLALVRGWRGVEQTPETAFVLAAALDAYPEGRAVHLVRDGRDVVCSLLERGWLSAGRRGGDDAKLAYGAGARFWVEPERAPSSRPRATRPAPRGRGAVTSLRRGRRRPAGARAALRVDRRRPGAAARARRAPRARRRRRSSEASRRSTTARSAATAGSHPEQLADVEREAGALLAELGYA